MSGCERDDEGFVIDPISLDQVPENRVITFEQFGVTFCFDIESLSTAVAQSGRFLNPLNRQQLPQSVINAVQEYRLNRDIQIIVHYVHENRSIAITVSKLSSIGDVLMAVYTRGLRRIPLGGHVTISHNGIGIARPENIYNYPLNSTIGDIIGNATNVGISVMNPSILPIDEPAIRARLRDLYLYAHSVGNRDIIERIPETYHPYIPENPDALDQKILSEFILDNRNKSDDYLIRGLTKLFAGTKISARFANAVHRGLAGRIYNAQAQWLPVLHLLYSRVVDPSNLSRDPNIPVQSQYYLAPGVRPTYESKYELIRQGIRTGGVQRSPPSRSTRLSDSNI